MTADLKEDWLRFELEEFPETCLGRRVGEFSWEQVDAVAAACISTWLTTGALDRECLAVLDDAILRLAEMTALADVDECSYFETLLDFARRVRDESVKPG
jgi:hypothetical protein